VALHVTDWTTGSGYVLDYRGGFSPFGGAPALGSGSTPTVVPGIPLSASPSTRLYRDWSWDPSGSGQGYVLDLWGKLLPFGGATPPPRTGPRFPSARARRLQMRWSPSKMAITIDMHGRMYGDFASFTMPARPSTLGAIRNDIVRDFVVTNWTAPPSGHILDLQGGVHEFGSAANSIGFPYKPGADVARTLAVLSPTDPMRFWQMWSGGQSREWVSSTPPTVVAGAGDNEVQTVTITGAPTGGTFTLTWSGQTTAAIARNATATTVRTSLEALSNIGVGDVTVTGGPGPTTPWAVTFTGALSATDVPQMTATSSLTGGTTPAVAVTTTNAGQESSPAPTVTDTTRPTLAWDYSDPQGDTQAAWQLYVYTQAWADSHSMTNPATWKASALVAEDGINRTTRGITSPVDLPNGTYRFYVRAKDTAGQWSAWSSRGWTQNVPVPVTPTGLTAVANAATFSVALSVSATTGGSANLIRFDYSDDGGTTWAPVRGGDALTLAATTTATDRDIALGVTRTYRAVAYAIDPRVASVPSVTATATVGTLTHVLTAVDDPALGGRVMVQEAAEWSRTVTAGVFQGIGAEYPTVVSDGGPKARRTTLRIAALDAAAWAVIEALVESDSVLLYRDPLGEAVYCKVAGDWTQAKIRSAATQHLHTTTLPLVEVAPPAAAV
jgi:hypothetical protein